MATDAPDAPDTRDVSELEDAPDLEDIRDLPELKDEISPKFTPTARDLKSSTSRSASVVRSTSTVIPRVASSRDPVPQDFPGLPKAVTGVVSQSSPCESANAVLIEDLEQCYIPLINQVHASMDAADKISIDVVDCICATIHWRVGSEEIELSLKSSCSPPGNLSKAQSLEIHSACGVYPYDYLAILDAVGVQARLSNGDLYILMSQFSGSISMKPFFLIFALISLKEFII